MSQRLRRSLAITVDLYEPSEELPRVSKRFQGLATPQAPAVAGAAARISSRYESTKPGGVRRSNIDQMDTTDLLRLAASTPCGDGWWANVTGPQGYPETGTWLRVQGGPRASVRAGVKSFLVVRAVAPPWAPAP